MAAAETNGTCGSAHGGTTAGPTCFILCRKRVPHSILAFDRNHPDCRDHACTCPARHCLRFHQNVPHSLEIAVAMADGRITVYYSPPSVFEGLGHIAGHVFV